MSGPDRSAERALKTGSISFPGKGKAVSEGGGPVSLDTPAGAGRRKFAVRMPGGQILVVFAPSAKSAAGQMMRALVSAAIPYSVEGKLPGVFLAAGVIALNEWHISAC
jgi:hypothetical protein